KDVRDGLLGADFERADHQEIQVKVAEAEDDAKDEVWAGYRFVVLADSTDPSGLKVIDLGAGHSSASETLCGRIIAALKAEALLKTAKAEQFKKKPSPLLTPDDTLPLPPPDDTVPPRPTTPCRRLHRPRKRGRSS